MCMCTFLPVCSLSSITPGIDITAEPTRDKIGMTHGEGGDGIYIIEFLS